MTPKRLAQVFHLMAILLLEPTVGSTAPLTSSSALPGGFEDAKAPWVWRFPQDDGAHPAFNRESWVYSAFVATEEGAAYHIRMEVRRLGLKRAKETASAFEPMDLSVVACVVTDLTAKKSWQAWRRNRTGPSLALFREGVLKVRNEDASLSYSPPGHRWVGVCGPYRFDLGISSGVPPVFHGDQGLVSFGSGLFLRIYSRTRMWAGGVLTVDGKPLTVTGSAWMDHAFGSEGEGRSVPSSDRLEVVFSDGSQLMIHRLRTDEGKESALAYGTWVDPLGRANPLRAGDFIWEPLGGWKSPESGASYPLRWRVQVLGAGLEFETEAPVEEVEHFSGFPGDAPSWDGPVEVKGARKGRPVTGKGTLSLTGYAKTGVIR
jgi:predicted secreted hydrolase